MSQFLLGFIGKRNEIAAQLHSFEDENKCITINKKVWSIERKQNRAAKLKNASKFKTPKKKIKMIDLSNDDSDSDLDSNTCNNNNKYTKKASSSPAGSSKSFELPLLDRILAKRNLATMTNAEAGTLLNINICIILLFHHIL